MNALKSIDQEAVPVFKKSKGLFDESDDDLFEDKLTQSFNTGTIKKVKGII